jgi:glycosyltransferase involved in cell wall biosynthesis
MLRIVAVLAIRNEQAYLANCLKQLTSDDIKFAIVDNGSTDATAAILHEDRFAPWLADYRYLPFEGVLDRERLLMEQHELTRVLDADWIVHLDADEIIHPYGEGESLRTGISKLNAEGWDAINCDEFVFLPVDYHYEPDCEGMPPL